MGKRNATNKEKLETYKYEKDGCWLWTGGTNNVGYGMMRSNGDMKLVHRVSYQEYVNPRIPHNRLVCHSCYNYRCFNPDHLYLATKVQNSQQMLKDKRNYGRHRGYNHPIVTCEHCNLQLGYNMYKRWHGDNCKKKP